MNKLLSPLNNENGVALFVAVLILLVATMVGYFATQNTSIELQIAGNQRVYQRAFYRADAASMEGVQRLFNEAQPPPVGSNGLNLQDPALYPLWFYGAPQTSALENINNWINNGGVLGRYSDVDPNDGALHPDKDPAFAVAYQGIAPGAQWEVGQPTMRVLAIFGLYDPLATTEQVFLTTGFLVEY